MAGRSIDDTQVLDVPYGTPGAPPPVPRRRRRGRRVVLAVVLVLLVLAGAGAAGGALYLRSVERSVARIEAFGDVPEAGRPAKVAEGAANVLVLGSDSRDPANPNGSRSDTIILVHLPKGRSTAQLVSIPRDTWVAVPPTDDGRGGRKAKINAAYAWGGVPLMVRTVEGFTGVRIDHVALVDFSGFKEIIDALGGVEIDVEKSFTSTHSLSPGGRRDFTAGRQTMDGAAALDYARERFAFADGDFARIRHQQQVMKAIVAKAASGGLLANPARLNDFLRATADAATVDETMSVFDFAAELRHLRGNSLTFLTSPTRGTGRVGSQSVVLPDTGDAKALYDAVRRDRVPEILTHAR